METHALTPWIETELEVRYFEYEILNAATHLLLAEGGTAVLKGMTVKNHKSSSCPLYVIWR
jgi:hypothetical protein